MSPTQVLDALASPHDKVVAVASSALEYHVKPTHLRDLLSLLKPQSHHGTQKSPRRSILRLA